VTTQACQLALSPDRGHKMGIIGQLSVNPSLPGLWRLSHAIKPLVSPPQAFARLASSTAATADGVTVGPNTYTVFNIAGNKFRLIVKIEYRYRAIYVKDVLTHAEYDKGRWKV